jgi:hypothetical protein
MDAFRAASIDDQAVACDCGLAALEKRLQL